MATEKEITNILKQQFNRIEKEAVHYHNNPYLLENIHQYRVHLRTLRSLLKFIKPLMDEDSYEELNELLKKQGQSLSSVRDLDVFIEKINQTARIHSDLLDNYADVFQFLQEERLRVIEMQASPEKLAVSREMVAHVKERLDDLSLTLEETSSSDFIEKRLDKDQAKLKKEYDKTADSAYEQIHETRKLAKHVRYNADGYQKLLPKKKAKKIKKWAKKIQEELGAVTDAHVHRELLKKYKDEVEDDTLQEAFRRLLTYSSNKNQ